MNQIIYSVGKVTRGSSDTLGSQVPVLASGPFQGPDESENTALTASCSNNSSTCLIKTGKSREIHVFLPIF